MHEPGPEYACTACGSSNSEKFVNRHKAGRRCLSCGHEKLEWEAPHCPSRHDRTTGVNEMAYTMKDGQRETF